MPRPEMALPTSIAQVYATERLEVSSWPHLKRPVLVVTVGNVSRVLARFESDEAKDEFLSFNLIGAERTIRLV